MRLYKSLKWVGFLQVIAGKTSGVMLLIMFLLVQYYNKPPCALTNTNLGGCWRSLHPGAGGHLWGHREVAGTQTVTCWLAHTSTVNLTHKNMKYFLNHSQKLPLSVWFKPATKHTVYFHSKPLFVWFNICYQNEQGYKLQSEIKQAVLHCITPAYYKIKIVDYCSSCWALFS